VSTLTLVGRKTVIRRPIALALDETVYVATWLEVEKTEEGEKAKRSIMPVLIARRRDGTVKLIAGDAATAFNRPDATEPMPDDVRASVTRLSPPTSADNVFMTAETILKLVNGDRPDLVQLFRNLSAFFLRFVAFPEHRSVKAADYAALCAAYVISTYLIAAFPAVGYLWIGGLAGSGKTTVAIIISRTACMPLMASSSSTLASLRGHADAGGTYIGDNYESVNSKDESQRALRSFAELGYQQGAVVTLQVPSSTGRGWETERTSVYANRTFTAVADAADALASRNITITMFRTSDSGKASLSPMDDDNWDVKPQEIMQQCWMVAAHHLADAATIVRTITSANTGLTNRDLQIWRPMLAVARMVDTANGDTAVFNSLTRLAHALIRQRDEDNGSREAFVTRALAALYGPAHEPVTVAASQVMEKANALANEEDADIWGLDSDKKVGRLLTRMNVPRAERTGRMRGYLLTAESIARLQATYLPVVFNPNPDTSPLNVTDVINDTNVTPDEQSDDDISDVSDECDISTGTVADDLIADAWSALITWASGRCDPFTEVEEEAARIVALRIAPGESLGRMASRVFEQQRAWRTGTAEGLAADD